MPVISINQNFVLKFKCLGLHVDKVRNTLDDNKLVYEVVRTRFINIYEVRMNVTIRRADIVRKLLKPYNIYD